MLQDSAARRARTGILHLCATLNHGDPAREAVSLAVLTQRLGWRALIASAGGNLVNEAERAAVQHLRLPLDQRGVLARWRSRARLDSLIQRERPALIHAHGTEALGLACRLSRIHRIPLVIDLAQPVAHPAEAQTLLAHATQITGAIRVPTRMMQEYVVSTLHINPSLIVRIAPGIDLQNYNQAAISAERLSTLSRLWRLPENAIVALVPLPLEPLMGQATLLQALAEIPEERLYIVMVGQGRVGSPLRHELEQSVERLKLSGKVIMPDFCPDWPAAFWLANVVVAPNEGPRGQNRELLAAQALGRPVIITAMGANEEMVQKHETAWIVPSGNASALARALREVTRLNTDQRVALAENARFFVEEHFPQADWFNGMMELYERLIFTAKRRR